MLAGVCAHFADLRSTPICTLHACSHPTLQVQFRPQISTNLPMHYVASALHLLCMHVSRKIALTIICGCIVMHASQLGWNTSIKLPWHCPVIQVGGASAKTFAKFEHRTAPHRLQRSEATREMSSVMMTDELAARQVSTTIWSFKNSRFKVIACRLSGC